MLLANRSFKSEVVVNAFEVGIDNDCSQIIVKRQPAETDLHIIVVATKTMTDLERTGDEAHKIARMARQIHGSPLFNAYLGKSTNSKSE